MGDERLNAAYLCMGCMAYLPERAPTQACPRCGWIETATSDASNSLAPRTRLHQRYLVGRVIGEGGFGITYIAWDTLLENRLAIKEYFPADAASRVGNGPEVRSRSRSTQPLFDDGLDRFLAEARTLARFQDEPGIVQVRDYFRENGTGYLVMSYLDGKTLKAFLRDKGGSVPYAFARDLLMPVMDTLRLVHDSGLLHRDISPDNLFITYAGQVRLLDFGAAKSVVSERSRSLAAVYKQGYTPYEQYLEGGTLGPCTDIYALAATFYCAITGQVPQGALERHVGDRLAAPSSLGVAIPAAHERALMKALAIQPEQRYQSVAEFQSDLLAEPADDEERGKDENGNKDQEKNKGKGREKSKDDEEGHGERAPWWRLALDGVRGRGLPRLPALSGLSRMPGLASLPRWPRLGSPLLLPALLGGAALALLGIAVWVAGDSKVPRIADVSFPEQITIGRVAEMKISFEDSDGDLDRLEFTTRQGSWRSYTKDLSSMKGQTSGTISVTFNPGVAEEARLAMVLVDKQGNRSGEREVRFVSVAPPPSPPRLARLEAPSRMTAGERVLTRVHFEDVDGDVRRLRVTPLNTSGNFPPWEPDNIAGKKQGTIDYYLTLSTPGRWRFSYTLEDARGRASEARVLEIEVVPAQPRNLVPPQPQPRPQPQPLPRRDPPPETDPARIIEQILRNIPRR
ncbi:MAG: serine/threonine protein kinase [Burkholderiaceae bacterium]